MGGQCGKSKTGSFSRLKSVAALESKIGMAISKLTIGDDGKSSIVLVRTRIPPPPTDSEQEEDDREGDKPNQPSVTSKVTGTDSRQSIVSKNTSNQPENTLEREFNPIRGRKTDNGQKKIPHPIHKYIDSLSSKNSSGKKKVNQSEKNQKGKETGQGKKIGIKNLDWDKIDLTGKPAFRWDMCDEDRVKVKHILARPARDWGARQLTNKLTSEFRRYYTRYRIEVLKAKGCQPQGYTFMDREVRYARQCAILCVVKGVTPRQLLEYWHVNIGNFADRKMKIPPIAFLACPANIDSVACAVDAQQEEACKKWRPGDFTRQVTNHGFSDESTLHKDLRRTIEAAGIDTREYDDRFLLSVQHAARAKARGTSIFISNTMKPMVKAVLKLFREVEDED